MNIIKKLENMNMYQLQKICQKINVPCPKKKRNVIQALLNPLKMKYKMKQHMTMTVNEEILRDLQKYREQKEAIKIQKQMRGYLTRKKTTKIKKRCQKQIENFMKIIKSIDRDKKLHKKNPTPLRKKTFQLRKKQLKDCLQNKQSTYSQP